MTVVAVADGILNIEGPVKAVVAEELFSAHPIDRDLAEDSMVEEAILLKKSLGESLVLLTTAPSAFEKEMRIYMATGCDRAIRVQTDYGKCLDLALRAKMLAEILRKHVPDWRALLTIDRTPGGAAGVFHHYLAETLQVPGFSAVSRVNGDNEGLEVVTRSEGVIHKYWTSKPVVLGIASRLVLHSPSFMDVHKARKAPIEVVETSADASIAALFRGEVTESAAYGATRSPVVSGSCAAAAHSLSPDETAARLAEICMQAAPAS